MFYEHLIPPRLQAKFSAGAYLRARVCVCVCTCVRVCVIWLSHNCKRSFSELALPARMHHSIFVIVLCRGGTVLLSSVVHQRTR